MLQDWLKVKKTLREKVQNYDDLTNVLTHGYKSIKDDKTDANVKGTEDGNRKIQENFDLLEKMKCDAILNYEEHIEPLDSEDGEGNSNPIKAFLK